VKNMSSMLKIILVGLMGSMLLVSGVFAQEAASAAQMSFSDLIAQAEYSIKNNEPAAAIPVLKEIISRAGALDEKSAKESVQMARLQLGSAFSTLQRWADARSYTEEYLAGEPVKERLAALQILSQVAMAEQNWEELKSSAEMMLAENLGIKDKETAEQFLLQAQFQLGNYAETLAMLPEGLQRTQDPANIRAYRIMQLRCLFETGDMEGLIAALPVLFRGDSRDDVALNLTLLRIGDQLFDRQQYRKALAIYRLVKPKASLLASQQERLKKVKAGEGEKSWSIEELGQALETLQKVPDYDIHIAYRAAQIYTEQKRYWEAVVLFDQLYQKHSAKEEGQAAYFQKLLVLFMIGADEEAIAESTDYLDKNRSGLFPRMICTQLAQYYLQQQELKTALELGPRYIEKWSRAADEDERAQETDLRYLFSFAHFQLGEYDEALVAFDRVIQTSPDSQAAMDSNYWKAMCRLLQQNYELAYDQFMKYRQKWPRASFAPAALFRAGVCRFGLEDYEGAKDIFKTFIRDYPEDTQMPEALSMYGDLLAADGLIDEALVNYDRALQIVEKNYSVTTDLLLKKNMVAPATYAVLQAARALTADAEAYAEQRDGPMEQLKYRQIISWMERYNKSFGEDADWAQGVFWIGKAQMELGEADQAVKAYLDAVIRYGADPAQEGVAAILFDLAGMVKNRLPRELREPTLLAIEDDRNRAQSPTVQIQVDVLLAELNGTRDELGRTLLTREMELDAIPPSGLSLMCSAMLEAQDFSRSKEMFDHFSEHYKNSPFRAMSYQLLATDLYQQQKTDEAFELALDALGKYGATAETGWAQLMKGKIELTRGEYQTAAKTLNMIFKVRAWRGPISAEAMFRMADAWEKQGSYKKAFAFYQRTYLLYKASAGGQWAAEGYLRSAECLKKMGRASAARNTYRAMLLDEYVRELPQAQSAMDSLGPEETAELLAGRTNTMETVELEVSP